MIVAFDIAKISGIAVLLNDIVYTFETDTSIITMVSHVLENAKEYKQIYIEEHTSFINRRVTQNLIRKNGFMYYTCMMLGVPVEFINLNTARANYVKGSNVGKKERIREYFSDFAELELTTNESDAVALLYRHSFVDIKRMDVLGLSEL